MYQGEACLGYPIPASGGQFYSMHECCCCAAVACQLPLRLTRCLCATRLQLTFA